VLENGSSTEKQISNAVAYLKLFTRKICDKLPRLRAFLQLLCTKGFQHKDDKSQAAIHSLYTRM